MNKMILLLLTVMLPSVILGQQTKKVKAKEHNEVYYVLKSDMTTKHGEYNKYSSDKKLLLTGFYDQGKKDSIWAGFDFNGNLVVKYDFNNNDLVHYQPHKNMAELEYSIPATSNSSDASLSRPPILLGGNDFLFSEIARMLRYPRKALESGQSGKVFVLFTLNKLGETSNYRVENPLGYGMDDEAIRVVKMLSEYWLPGISNGEPVDVEVTFPINYTLK